MLNRITQLPIFRLAYSIPGLASDSKFLLIMICFPRQPKLKINIHVHVSVWCNFDHGLCSGWNQSSSDDFDWTLASVSTPSSSTGPAQGQGGSG